jgi:uncharacterized phiE125 gp8 family phage protein
MFPSTTAIRRVAPPAIEPVTLDEANAQGRIAGDDAMVAGLISAAVDMIDGDGLLGRAMISQTWAQWVPQSPGYVRLLMGPFRSLVSVEYYNAAGDLLTADLSDFEIRLSGDFVYVAPKDNAAWPAADDRLDAIKITYVAGFGDSAADVPQSIRHAILMLVAHWYNHREASTDLTLRDVPFAVESLLNRHRVAWYG